VNSLSLRMSLEDINEEIIDDIREQTGKHTGKAQVKFSIYDESEGISIELFSRNTSVTVTNELISYLKEHPEIEYMVN